MKFPVATAALLLVLASPCVSLAQTGGPTAPKENAPLASQEKPASAPQEKTPEEQLAEHKADFLAHLHELASQLQEHIDCVEAATTHDGLHACMPKPRGLRPFSGPIPADAIPMNVIPMGPTPAGQNVPMPMPMMPMPTPAAPKTAAPATAAPATAAPATAAPKTAAPATAAPATTLTTTATPAAVLPK